MKRIPKTLLAIAVVALLAADSPEKDKPIPPQAAAKPKEQAPLPDEKEAVDTIRGYLGKVGFDKEGRVHGITCDDTDNFLDSRLIAALPHLESLEVTAREAAYPHNPIKLNLSPLLKAPRLRWLSVSRPKMDDDLLKDIGKLETLDYLKLATVQVSGSGLARLQLPRLRVLDVQQYPIRGEDMHAIGRLRSLRELSLNWAVTAEQLNELEPLTQLEKLKLRPAMDADLAAIGRIHSLMYLDHLSKHATDEGLKGIQTLTNLRELGLGPLITDAGMVYVSRLTGLESLSLPEQIGDAGVAKIANLSNLTYLYVAETRITDASAATIAGLHKLTCLLAWHTRLSDKGVAKFSQLKCLTKLDLSTTNVTDECLWEIRKLPELVYLYLNNTRITPRGLNRLRGMPNLGIVDADNTAVTSEDAHQLSENGVPVSAVQHQGPHETPPGPP